MKRNESNNWMRIYSRLTFKVMLSQCGRLGSLNNEYKTVGFTDYEQKFGVAEAGSHPRHILCFFVENVCINFWSQLCVSFSKIS